jgi:Flp pilus assembly protein CpaB
LRNVVPERLATKLGTVRGPRPVLIRRILAVLLLLAAAGLAARSAFGGQRRPAVETAPVVVAAHDLAPGAVLAAPDVLLRRLPSSAVPSGALDATATAVGKTLAGAARAGEPITDVRLVGAANLALTTGSPDAAAVPVRLADPGLATLLRPGTRVEVISLGDAAPSGAGRAANVLVADAAVVTVRRDGSEGPGARTRGTLVVLGVPRDAAPKVAAASLNGSLTVALR